MYRCEWKNPPGLRVSSLQRLDKDEYVAVLPYDHPLTSKTILCPQDLNDLHFMLLEHGGKTEVSEFLERNRIKPDISFTTWDDYAILSMVESGLGVSVLPKMILRRIPYNVQILRFSEPLYREIGLACETETPLLQQSENSLSILDAAIQVINLRVTTILITLVLGPEPPPHIRFPSRPDQYGSQNQRGHRQCTGKSLRAGKPPATPDQA